MGDGSPRERGLAGQVDQRRDLHRIVDHDVVLGDVHEELLEVDLLLIAGAEQVGLLHTGDREDRLMVELRVVQTVQQVDPARAGRRQADAQTARRFGVCRRHEGGGFLVHDEDEPNPILVPTEALRESVDAVARQTEDGVDAPVDEPFDEQLGGDLHRSASFSVRSQPYGRGLFTVVRRAAPVRHAMTECRNPAVTPVEDRTIVGSDWR